MEFSSSPFSRYPQQNNREKYKYSSLYNDTYTPLIYSKINDTKSLFHTQDIKEELKNFWFFFAKVW